jgi:hypothetical protein
MFKAKVPVQAIKGRLKCGYRLALGVRSEQNVKAIKPTTFQSSLARPVVN